MSYYRLYIWRTYSCQLWKGLRIVTPPTENSRTVTGDWSKAVDMSKVTVLARVDPTKNVSMPDALTKRYRVKRCNAKLRVPDEANKSEVVFTCQKQEHAVVSGDPTTWHQERAFIDYGNDSGRESIVTWKDMGLIATRRRTKQLKVQRA